MTRLRLFTAVRYCLLGSILWSAALQAGEIERQRELFRETYAEVERGNWGVIESLEADDQQRLRAYVLWPDLRATWMRANINSIPDSNVDAFVQQYGTLKPARELRYRQALNYVRNKDLAGYLRIYEQFYRGQEITKLDCLALQADIEVGQHRRVERRAVDLWLIGESQVAECDPVFDYLGKQNLLGLTEYQKRFDLAVEARNFTLAKWLAKKIDQQHVDTASNWQQAQTNPEDFLRLSRKSADDQILKEQLVYATERLTYRDPEIAHELWGRVAKKHKFSEAQKLRTARHIALWTARDNLPDAYKRLVKLPAAAKNEEVLRWCARVSLREERWKRLLADVAAMPAAESNTEEWRYWQAIAQIESGQALSAVAELESLRLERSYYGFLAADKLSKGYALDHVNLLTDEVTLTALESRPELVRARELFLVGQDSRVRSEWDAVILPLSNDEKLQAAVRRKLRSTTEPAHLRIERHAHNFGRIFEQLVGHLARSRSSRLSRRVLLYTPRYLISPLEYLSVLGGPGAGELGQYLLEPRPPELVIRREISARIPGLAIRRQPKRVRPPPLPRKHLRSRHVHLINIRPLLAIDLNRHIKLIEYLRHGLGLERFAFHYVTPVAGGVPDRQEDRLAFLLGLGESRRRPGVPVNRVPRMLQEIRTLLVNKPIKLLTPIRRKLRNLPSRRKRFPRMGAFLSGRTRPIRTRQEQRHRRQYN